MRLDIVPPMSSPPTADESLRELLLEHFWLSRDIQVRRVGAQLAARDPSVDADGEAGRTLREALSSAWERGWQPADVVHVAGREGSPRMRRLVVSLISEDAELSQAWSRAPDEWLDQLRSLGALDAPQGVHAWHLTERLRPATAWEDVLLLAGVLRLRHLVPLPVLLPPPSRWGTEPSRAAGPAAFGEADAARILRRIRGLLAKAESTEFPEEAEALTAKAQELMSAHAIDQAVFDAERSDDLRTGVRSRRLHVDEPYVEAKMMLLSQVGEANGVRTAWYRSMGIATCVGMPVDLEAVELLFTSLLVQATRAMTAAGVGDPDARSAAFRRSFLLSYGSRIGERLAAVRFRATSEAATARGIDALPVLRGRQEAVDVAYEELFPTVRSKRSRAFDASGWHAGRRAANQADLRRGRGRLPR
jgi:hypothetical protein